MDTSARDRRLAAEVIQITQRFREIAHLQRVLERKNRRLRRQHAALKAADAAMGDVVAALTELKPYMQPGFDYAFGKIEERAVSSLARNRARTDRLFARLRG